MRKVIGWLFFLLGAFVLGILAYKTGFNSQELVSPIPEKDSIRVIMLTPSAR